MKDETSRLAFQLISTFEGCSLTPYLCPSGHWTIGYGMTFLPDGAPVTRQTNALSQNEADILLGTLIDQFSRDVMKTLPDVTLKPCQKAALISFAYNEGLSALEGSTLLKKLKAGDMTGAANEFPKWNKMHRPDGKTVISNGLSKRRQVERDVFLGRGFET